MFWIVMLLCLGCSVKQVQSPGVRAEWSSLGKNSTTVVVGVVEAQVLVVHSKKMGSTSQQLPNGNVLVGLPNPAEYLIGHVIRMRVIEVVKTDVNRKAAPVINIFVPGQASTEASSGFVDKQEYIAFLSPLKDGSKEFADAVIYDPNAPSKQKPAFTPRSHYVVVWGKNGLVRVTPQNSNILEEIRMSLGRPKR